MNYCCYNLTIASEIPLPELFAAPEGGEQNRVDVHVRMGSVSLEGLPGGQQMGPFMWATNRALWLHVPKIARYLVVDGCEITIDPEPHVDEDTIRGFLFGSGFGAMLLQRQLLVLHGMAVRVGDGCLVCLGGSGAGKSTLAAAFLQRGFDILSDDVVAIDQQNRALPSLPRLKLWQDTADKLAINTEGLRYIRPGIKKFNFSVRDRFVTEALLVKKICIIHSHNKDEFIYKTIAGVDRLLAIINNTYRLEYMKGMALEGQKLGQYSHLVEHVALVSVKRPREGFDVDRLVAGILDTGKDG